MDWTRRQWLAGALGLGVMLFMPEARAIGPGQRAKVLRLRHGGMSELHPGSLEYLMEEMAQRTSVDMALQSPTVLPESREMLSSLFAVVIGRGAFAFTEAQRQHLSRWVDRGGLLIFDNAGQDQPDEAFDRSARREIARIVPGDKLARISPEHVIYRSFYRLDYPAGRAIFRPYVEGARVGSRYGVILSSNDLFGALAREEGGAFRYRPSPGGESQREMAIRFAINLFVYALTLHYKDDQVHIDYLLKKRAWKVRPPE